MTSRSSRVRYLQKFLLITGAYHDTWLYKACAAVPTFVAHVWLMVTLDLAEVEYPPSATRLHEVHTWNILNIKQDRHTHGERIGVVAVVRGQRCLLWIY